MTKRFMLLIAAMFMSTLTIQANQEPVTAEFTVTQVALDAAKDKASEAEPEEDKNTSTEEIQAKGGASEEK
jgi:hypothetical protein